MGLGHYPAVVVLVPQVIAQRAGTRIYAWASWNRAPDGFRTRGMIDGRHAVMLFTNVLGVCSAVIYCGGAVDRVNHRDELGNAEKMRNQLRV